jgi:S-adenosylmethionine synthetase
MVILQRFAQIYDDVRQFDTRFLSDGKAQITGEYDKHRKLRKIKTFTICYQNTECDRQSTDKILKDIAVQLCDEYDLSVDQFLINPTGKFEIGGFDGDAGLTGRKIVVDTYQSFAKVGGGNMNGKDYTKVDFSGAHYARFLAKFLLNKHKLHWCEVQIAFGIGVNKPLSLYVTSDKGNIDVGYDISVKEIIELAKTNCYDLVEAAKFGHFTH